jgi:hypothetical protein
MNMTRIRPTARLLSVVLCALLATVRPAAAAVELDPVCASATATVAAETGVPHEVLAAISLTETGRNSDGATRSWPWTVNSEGKGFWFNSQQEALAFARSELSQGTVSFDVGCFQINYRWHGENFASVEEMFDPVANARYAARFLTDLYQELGDWSQAAGAYHSRTQVYAQKYRGRFNQFLASLGDGEIPVGAPMVGLPAQPRTNNFPLLMASNEGARSIGSLVPLGPQGNRLVPLKNSTWALR